MLCKHVYSTCRISSRPKSRWITIPSVKARENYVKGRTNENDVLTAFDIFDGPCFLTPGYRNCEEKRREIMIS